MSEDARQMLNAAYLLLCEFQEVINDQLEGDHQSSQSVDRWLTLYEKENKLSANLESAMIEGYPV